MSDESQAQFARGMHVALTVAATHKPIGDLERSYLIGFMTGFGIELAEGLGDEQFAKSLEALAAFVRDWRKAHETQRGN